MKHLNTFAQHINESNGTAIKIGSSEWRPLGDRSDLSGQEMDKIKNLCDLARFDLEEWRKIVRIAKQITATEHVPPAVSFFKTSKGIYYLDIVDKDKDQSHYKSTAFDPLIPLAIDALQPEIEWKEIK